MDFEAVLQNVAEVVLDRPSEAKPDRNSEAKATSPKEDKSRQKKSKAPAKDKPRPRPLVFDDKAPVPAPPAPLPVKSISSPELGSHVRRRPPLVTPVNAPVASPVSPLGPSAKRPRLPPLSSQHQKLLARQNQKQASLENQFAALQSLQQLQAFQGPSSPSVALQAGSLANDASEMTKVPTRQRHQRHRPSHRRHFQEHHQGQPQKQEVTQPGDQARPQDANHCHAKPEEITTRLDKQAGLSSTQGFFFEAIEALQNSISFGQQPENFMLAADSIDALRNSFNFSRRPDNFKPDVEFESNDNSNIVLERELNSSVAVAAVTADFPHLEEEFPASSFQIEGEYAGDESLVWQEESWVDVLRQQHQRLPQGEQGYDTLETLQGAVARLHDTWDLATADDREALVAARLQEINVMLLGHMSPMTSPHARPSRHQWQSKGLAPSEALCPPDTDRSFVDWNASALPERTPSPLAETALGTSSQPSFDIYEKMRREEARKSDLRKAEGFIAGFQGDTLLQAMGHHAQDSMGIAGGPGAEDESCGLLGGGFASIDAADTIDLHLRENARREEARKDDLRNAEHIFSTEDDGAFEPAAKQHVQKDMGGACGPKALERRIVAAPDSESEEESDPLGLLPRVPGRQYVCTCNRQDCVCMLAYESEAVLANLAPAPARPSASTGFMEAIGAFEESQEAVGPVEYEAAVNGFESAEHFRVLRMPEQSDEPILTRERAATTGELQAMGGSGQSHAAALMLPYVDTHWADGTTGTYANFRYVVADSAFGDTTSTPATPRSAVAWSRQDSDRSFEF